LDPKTVIMTFELYTTFAWMYQAATIVCFCEVTSVREEFFIPNKTVCVVIGATITILGILLKAWIHYCIGFESYCWRDLITRQPNKTFYRHWLFTITCGSPTYTLGYINNYGVAFISQSYSGFFMAFILHIIVNLWDILAERPWVKFAYHNSENKKID